MIRIVVFYLAIQLNGLLVSLYLKEYLTIEDIVLLQWGPIKCDLLRDCPS